MQTFKLFLLRYIYGKYSYHYQDHFRKNSTSGSKKKKHLRRCSRIDGLSHYMAAFDTKNDVPEFEARQKILFNNKEFGSSFKKIKRAKRKFSCYDISHYNNCYWRRLGYRERIFNTGVTFVYHFLDNVYFFGEFFFSDVRKLDLPVIARTLIQKYTGREEQVAENFKITGDTAFIFFHNNGINLSIKYICTGDENINRKIKSIPLKSIEYSGKDMPEFQPDTSL